MKMLLFCFLMIAGVSSISQHASAQSVTKGFIKAGNLDVYYERTGKGNSVILLHAGLQDHTMWHEQVKSLSKAFDVITPDLPFHGKTTGSDSNILAAEVIKIILDSLHIEKTSIAGLSMGASVAEDFIIAYPYRVNKAFLISAGINGYDKTHEVDSASKDWVEKFGSALDRGDTATAAKEFTKAWAEGIYRSKENLQSAVSKYVYKTTLSNLKVHKMEGWPKLQNDPPAMEAIASIKVPVLVINGDKDLPYITATSQYLAKHIYGARHIVIKNVAHMLNMEKPAQLNNILLTFLREK